MQSGLTKQLARFKEPRMKDFSQRFPWFIRTETERQQMEGYCQDQLAEWRRVCNRHYRPGRSLEHRLKHFPAKALAFETLRSTYLASIELQCVAA